MISEQDDRLERLLNQLADGTLTEDDGSRLTEILRTDPAARRQYRQFMALHADLHWDDAVAAVMQPGERTGSWRQVWKWKGQGKRLWATAMVWLVVISASLWFAQHAG